MATATWKSAVIAEGNDTEIVEGNVYFAPSLVQQALLRPSTKTTTCPWKGECNYFDVVVNGEVNADAAWVYHDPKPAAAQVKDRVAFWRGVEVKR